MKHSSKLFSLCLYAAMGIFLQSCGPETRITGMVHDDQTGTAVPGTAVLGMVWIEDVYKALPAPDTKKLKSEDRDIALDKDTTDRGLPVAYARTFTDSNGRFELDNFHFSASTKKAVKAMKQPKVTRVTMWAFQKGYRKQAVTLFPKTVNKELPAATLLLARPTSWKDLYVENTVNSLTEKYMLKGYSKEFGATKAEKSWIFEYTRANEQQAYDTSDIKGDKKMEEMCGHDYSDIIVSTAGIQRNPAREKCGELLKRIGSIREVEELWLAHSNIKREPLTVAKEVVKQALNTLPAEAAEPKEYEAWILTGLEAAWKTQSKEAMRNGVSEQKWRDEAKLLYGKGDKTAAYRALGYVLNSLLPEETMQGVLTAQLTIKTIPGIKDAAAGFYLLMTRPQTAQLPGGDGGNHKDKPAYKIEVSTETTMEVQDYGRIKIRREKTPETGEKEIVFYDAKGKHIKQLKIHGWDIPRISLGHSIVAIQKYSTQAQDLEIFNATGNMIKEHKKIKPYEIVHLLDDGSFVVSGFKITQHRAHSGGLAFYDGKGNLLKDIFLERLGNNVGGFFGKDTYFAFLMNIPGKDMTLQCYTKEGRMAWEYTFKAIGLYNLSRAFSVESGNVLVKIVSANEKRTWIFNEKGFLQKVNGW